jgi:L-malate glycosyltransferase
MDRVASGNLCLVLPWSFTINGGVNQVVNNLIRQLHNNGHCKPLALELQWNHKLETDTLPENATPRVYIRLRPPYLPEKPLLSIVAFLLFLPGELLRLRRLVRQYRIGAFNFHFPDLTGITFILLRMCGLFTGKVVLSFHGSDIRAGYQQKGLTRVLWKFMLRHASAAVAPSHALAEEIEMLQRRTRTITIHNGIDIAYFSTNAGAGFQWPGLLDGKRIIVNVGGFEYRKGHDILIQAFEQLAGRYPDVHLVFVGARGSTSTTVREMIDAARLSERIHIFENVPYVQIYDILTRAELFVLASRWRKGSMGEGFPMATLEAAAVKLPVVSTASCGVSELIRDQETGLLVELENPTALADAISQMLDDPPAARRMAERLYALVASFFTWEHAACEYRKLCCRNGARSSTKTT